MVTRNFYCMISNPTKYVSSSFSEGKRVGLKRKDGTLLTNLFDVGSGEGYLASLWSNTQLIIGSGNTDPTPDDYCLESQVNLLSISNGNDATTFDMYADYNQSKVHYITVSGIFQNTTDSSVTIKELGILTREPSSGSSNWFLLSRDVIDPVTIEPGSQYGFSVSINIPIPSSN